MTREEAVRRIERAADEKLMELDLSGLELEEVPPEIAKCTQLETLLLARSYEKKKNKLTKFSDAILQLTNLKTLNLSHNQITCIPEAIGQLSNLTQLTLFGAQITQLPEAIGQLSNLTELDLEYNQITQLPEAFS
jgi:internalin A